MQIDPELKAILEEHAYEEAFVAWVEPGENTAGMDPLEVVQALVERVAGRGAPVATLDASSWVAPDDAKVRWASNTVRAAFADPAGKRWVLVVTPDQKLSAQLYDELGSSKDIGFVYRAPRNWRGYSAPATPTQQGGEK